MVAVSGVRLWSATCSAIFKRGITVRGSVRFTSHSTRVLRIGRVTSRLAALRELTLSCDTGDEAKAPLKEHPQFVRVNGYGEVSTWPSS